MTRDEWLKSQDPAAMLRWLTGRLGQEHNPGGWSYPTAPQISPRKLRLFACACARLAWDKLTDDVKCQGCAGARVPGHPEAERLLALAKSCTWCKGTGRINRSRRAAEVAEAFADGLATEEELFDARRMANDAHDANTGESGAPSYDAWACCIEDITVCVRRIVFGESSSSPAAQADLLRSIVGDPFDPVRWRTTGILRCGICGLTGHTEEGAHAQVLTLARAAYEDRLSDGSLDPFRLCLLADALEEAGCTSDPLLAALRTPGPKFRGFWPVDLLLGKE